MALQSSGPISLLDIQNEFGGTNPIGINEYYGADTGVPASGTISFDDFYGTSSTVDPVQNGLVLSLDAGNAQSYSGSGATWTDLTGSNNGTIDGSTYNSGDGGYFIFDGTNDNVKIPYTASSNISDTLFNGSNNFTVEFWFNADNLPSDGGTNFRKSQCLLGGGGRNFLINFGDSLDDKEVTVRTNMGSWISPVGSGADSINNNTWYNVIVTYDSSSGFVLYLNGVQESTSSTTGNITAGSFDTSNKLIGCLIDNSSNSNFQDRFFDGKISVCRIYNKVLTATEAQQNYNAVEGRYA